MVSLAAEGDADAFAALIVPRHPRLLLLLAATVGDWHEAEDTLQEVLWRAFCQLPRLRDPRAFDAWLRRAAVNAARNRLQAALARVRREGTPAGDPADLQRLLDAAAEAEAAAAASSDPADCSPILDAIAELPALQRRAGSLAWVAGVPPAAIADLLSIKTGHVHVALHRARRRLAAAIDWQRATLPPPPDAVLIGGYAADRWLGHLRTARPDLHLRLDAAPDAHVFAAPFQEEPPLLEAAAPPAPAEALPLDGLADAAAFSLEPFGDRLLRHTWGDRPYRLPHHARLRAVVYNADLLRRAGLPLPNPDWTWDQFITCCRRCTTAGFPALARTPGGAVLAHVAEQLGAAADNLGPVRDAVAFLRDHCFARLAVPDGAEDTWYLGRAAFDFMHSAQPAQGFELHALRPFPWGIAPFPRFRRSDPPVAHWTRVAITVRGTAPDPVAAFAAVRALFTDGPPCSGGELPAYRAPEAMRAWTAQTLPLGRNWLLRAEADCGPLHTAAWLTALPGAGAVLAALAEGEMDAETGLTALRRCGACR